MNRFVKQDFLRLQEYLENYSLASDLGAKAREDLLKRAHKHTLASLQVWSCLERNATEGALVLSGNAMPAGSEQLAQLSEFFSDLVSALLLSVHGLYKPAHMSIRSGIETFVRGLAALTSNEARTTTSVYRLFEIAAQQPPFVGKAAAHFHRLNTSYGELCLFTHSATPAHMVRNYALAAFPRQDTVQMRSVVRHLEQVVNAALSVLVLAYRDAYLQIPAAAREVLDEVLPPAVKIYALGGSR